MDPLAYLSSDFLGSWRDDVSMMRNAIQKPLTLEDETAVGNYFKHSLLWRVAMTVPTEVYYISRICRAVLICHYAQWVGDREEIRLAKYQVNVEVIEWVNHAITGWFIVAVPLSGGNARLGLAGHSFRRLVYRAAHFINDYTRRRFGYPDVESGEKHPIDYRMLRLALWTRLKLVTAYVQKALAIGMVYVAEKLGTQQFKTRMENRIEELSQVLRHEMDVPRYQFALIAPFLGSEQADPAVEFVRSELANFAQKSFRDGKAFKSILATKVWDSVVYFSEYFQAPNLLRNMVVSMAFTTFISQMLSLLKPESVPDPFANIAIKVMLNLSVGSLVGYSTLRTTLFKRGFRRSFFFNKVSLNSPPL